jgi:hypothetical protein
MFNRSTPLIVKPQTREAVGWLNYQCDEYIVISWDKDADPPSLKGGDPKASGLVLLKSAIIELSQYDINITKTPQSNEYALQTTKRKTQQNINSKEKTGETIICQ